MGAWPVRPRPRRPYWLTFLSQGIAASLSILAVTFFVGIAFNVGAMLVFGLGLGVALVVVVLYAVVWVLVGAVYRRLND